MRRLQNVQLAVALHSLAENLHGKQFGTTAGVRMASNAGHD